MTKRQQAIADLSNYIWSLKGKSDSISEINKQLIDQYCRFAVMADEVSVFLEKKMNTLPPDEFDAKMKIYEKLNKTTLGLYKTLKFEQIKDELADYGNPFLALHQAAERDGDL